MSTAMDAVMWDTDHYVTQVNPEPGPAGPRGISTDGMNCAKAHNCRDFVDYDSNVRQQHNCSAPARRPGDFFLSPCATDLNCLWLHFAELLSFSCWRQVIAVAHGVGGPAKAKATLERIDRGKGAGSSAPVQKCTAMQGGGPQWTSEIWYPRDRSLPVKPIPLYSLSLQDCA